MLKKISFLLLFFLIPSFVFASAFDGNNPNSYFGYALTMTRNSNIEFQAYYNEQYAEDVISNLQVLNSNVENSYVITLDYRSIYYPGYVDSNGTYIGVIGDSLNDTSVKYFVLDLCVSTNNLNFWITNGNVDDFSTNDSPYYVILDQQCTINAGTNVDIEGPTYWSWLGKDEYQGYVMRISLPISIYRHNGNGVYRAASFFHIKNSGDYSAYFSFLTSSALYDHSIILDYDTTFQQNTDDFDATYDAIMDGLGIIDDKTQLHWQVSKNLNSQGIRTGLYSIANGIYVNSSTYVTINDLLPIEYGKTITVSTELSRIDDFAFVILEYDENKNYLNDYYYGWGKTATYTIHNSNTKYIAIDIGGNATIENVGNIQVELGSYHTSYCPYGPTLDNSCVSHYVEDLIIWDDSNIFTNIYNILNLPIRLGQFLLAGSNGQCSPVSFVIFNQEVSLPCGSFFWNRNDVADFRIFWNLLFGGFLIFKCVVWFIKVLTSVIDPLGDSTSLALNSIDVKSSKRGDR